MKKFAVTVLAGAVFAAEEKKSTDKCEQQVTSLFAACEKGRKTIQQTVEKIKDAKRRKETLKKYERTFMKCIDQGKKIESICRSKNAVSASNCDKPSRCQQIFKAESKGIDKMIGNMNQNKTYQKEEQIVDFSRPQDCVKGDCKGWTMASKETIMTDNRGEPYLDLRISIMAPKKMDGMTNWMTVFVENYSETRRNQGSAHTEAYGCLWTEGLGFGKCYTQDTYTSLTYMQIRYKSDTKFKRNLPPKFFQSNVARSKSLVKEGVKWSKDSDTATIHATRQLQYRNDRSSWLANDNIKFFVRIVQGINLEKDIHENEGRSKKISISLPNQKAQVWRDQKRIMAGWELDSNHKVCMKSEKIRRKREGCEKRAESMLAEEPIGVCGAGRLNWVYEQAGLCQKTAQALIAGAAPIVAAVFLF